MQNILQERDAEMTSVKRTTTNRVLILDLFRVMATFMVIFSHILFTLGRPWQKYQLSFGIHPFYWATWGEIGVTIFLVLSGLSLEYTYGGRQIEFGPFYKKRMLRIYPVYYMSLLVGVTAYVAFAYAGRLRGSSSPLLPPFGCLDLFLTLTGFNAFAGNWGGPFVWSSWFIGVIMVLYLCYPVISWGCRKSPWTCIVLLFLISLISRTIIGQHTDFPRSTMQWFPLNRIFEFGLGVFIASLVKQEIPKSLNHSLERVSFLPFFSAISFPLFLIHDPLRRLILIGPNTLLSRAVGIALFLALAIILSRVALALDQRIKKKMSLSLRPLGRAE
jgi:peptidoglycan/LPS O-acetylase OafA/YrhL